MPGVPFIFLYQNPSISIIIKLKDKEPKSVNNKKLLIIEDEVPLRKALAEEFIDAGYTVFEAGDGLEGYDTALREHPDLILLDQLMPKMNGVTMLRQLRNDPWGSSVPVIMATNMSTTDTINESIDAGANDYFIKSEVSVADILKLVEEHLQNS